MHREKILLVNYNSVSDKPCTSKDIIVVGRIEPSKVTTCREVNACIIDALHNSRLELNLLLGARVCEAHL